MKRLIAAIAFAAVKYRDQRRKDAEASPYINHPIALANVLANEADIDDERVLIAAILHDTVEDTETTVRSPRMSASAFRVIHSRSISRRAKLVKLADKICHVRDIAGCPPPD